MRPNETEFRWDSRRERAAILVAADELADHAIAEDVGVSKATLERWKQHPIFRERVAEHAAVLEAAVQRLAIAKRRKRVEFLDEQVAKLRQVIDARAVDPLMADVPGGTTGLLVAEPLLVKVYDSNDIPGDDDASGLLTPRKQSELVYKYAVDTGTLRELRATLEQAAKEMGQWSERHEVAGDPNAPISFTIKIATKNDGEEEA